MCLSSICVKDVSQIFASKEDGEWVILGFITLKESRRKPANPGEDGDKYCSKTSSLSINLSASIGT